jgi:3-isopropylmalate/(R)-2-methylmalate dehydratase large subunit
MGQTLCEKILSAHAGRAVRPGEIADVTIDVRAARDFGGANVVKNLREHGLGVADASRTCFTFDCNPTGSDQKYAANQHLCRQFAREHGIRVFDIDQGIGTHVAIENGLIGPGGTLVSTDSHANILGAIGAFGQGMGDTDIAAAFAHGRVWFEVPKSVKVLFVGKPSPRATAKDLTLAALRRFGANGLLGYAAELCGQAVDALDLDGRITLASMATEMGAIIGLIAPSDEVIAYCKKAGATFTPAKADADAEYDKTTDVDVAGLEPLIAKPGHPEDVVPVSEVEGTAVDSVVIGSCTNGRYADLVAAAELLRGRKVAAGVVLKVVPATDALWRRCLADGLLSIFKEAGALVGNAGCAGCAAGQIGQNGPGEVTVSTGNRNFAGKQGQGKVFLASPETAAASAIAGVVTTAAAVRAGKTPKRQGSAKAAAAPATSAKASQHRGAAARPVTLRGRVWLVGKDNIDTDMIFHNRHLAITDVVEMGQHTFGNLPGWEDFAKRARPGDIVVTGKNFGCGSSRQQAVDCFRSLGIALIVAESFGAIYERNAINTGMPILAAELLGKGLKDGDEVEVDLGRGAIALGKGAPVQGRPFSDVQMQIYQRGGLLEA